MVKFKSYYNEFQDNYNIDTKKSQVGLTEQVFHSEDHKEVGKTNLSNVSNKLTDLVSNVTFILEVLLSRVWLEIIYYLFISYIGCYFIRVWEFLLTYYLLIPAIVSLLFCFMLWYACEQDDLFCFMLWNVCRHISYEMFCELSDCSLDVLFLTPYALFYNKMLNVEKQISVVTKAPLLKTAHSNRYFSTYTTFKGGVYLDVLLRCSEFKEFINSSEYYSCMYRQYYNIKMKSIPLDSEDPLYNLEDPLFREWLNLWECKILSDEKYEWVPKEYQNPKLLEDLKDLFTKDTTPYVEEEPTSVEEKPLTLDEEIENLVYKADMDSYFYCVGCSYIYYHQYLECHIPFIKSYTDDPFFSVWLNWYEYTDYEGAPPMDKSIGEINSSCMLFIPRD